jgi:hypothetical protein
MAIPEPYRRNFETLRQAALAGDLALMECTDASTGVPRYVVCAVGRADNGDYLMTPFGHLCDENPYEIYLPPTGGSPR